MIAGRAMVYGERRRKRILVAQQLEVLLDRHLSHIACAVRGDLGPILTPLPPRGPHKDAHQRRSSSCSASWLSAISGAPWTSSNGGNRLAPWANPSTALRKPSLPLKKS